MVRTVAKVGLRAGQPLWRCSDFDCPMLININESDATPATRVAGQSAQAEFERLRAGYKDRLTQASALFAAITVFSTVTAFLIVLVVSGDLRPAAMSGLLVVVLVAGFFSRYIPSEIVYWGKGAEAERAVGARLDGLEPLGFVTLYDRQVYGRGGNIDAVVVGPPGVYVVETKSRGRSVEVIQGRLEVGGHEQTDAIRQVTQQAMLVQVSVAQAMNRHRMTVVPIICIGNRSVSGSDRAGGVLVTDVSAIARRLASEPSALSPADVLELAKLLDQALPAFERRTA